MQAEKDALARFVALAGRERPGRLTREAAHAVARELGVGDGELARAEEVGQAALVRAEALLGRGLLDDALAAADEATGLLPWEVEAHAARARVLARRWRERGARADREAGETLLRALVELRPDDPRLLEALGMLRGGPTRATARRALAAVAIVAALGGILVARPGGFGAPWSPEPVVVSRVSPLLGPPGQWVYVAGGGFVEGRTTVEVGGVDGIPAVVYDAERLGFTVPDGATGETPVVVRVDDGRAVSGDAFRVGTPAVAPEVLVLSPSEAPPGGWVYVSGRGFVLGRTTVAFGPVDGIPALVYGPDSLGFNVPSDAEGAHRVRITTPLGSAESAASLRVVQP